LLLATPATAQTVATGATTVTTTTMSASPQSEPAPPPQQFTPAAPATDHDMFVGSFAVGFFGVETVPIAINPKTDDSGTIYSMSASRGEVRAPVVGVRYWFNRVVGLDFGFGAGIRKGSQTYTMSERPPAGSGPLGSATDGEPVRYTFEQNLGKQMGFVFHLGLPFALSRQKHYSFIMVPEMNVGFSSGTVTFEEARKPSATEDPRVRDDIKLSGFSFDAGLRAGTEIHFGFVGLPNLALQASVGFKFSVEKIKADGGSVPPRDETVTTRDAVPKTTYEMSNSEFSTTVRDTPWAIFENTISALYYF